MSPAHHTSLPWSTGVPGPRLLEDAVSLTFLLEVINEVQPDDGPERKTQISLITVLKTVNAK